MSRTLPLATVAVVLASTVVASLGVSAPAPAAASPVEIAGLGLWNWDIETADASGAPGTWSAVPARPTAAARVQRIVGVAPFARIGYANRLNHVAWVWDNSRTASAQMRSRPVDAAPGRHYIARATAGVGRGRAATLNLEFLSASGRRLSLARQTSAAPRRGSTTRVAVKAYAPAGTASARLLVASEAARVGSSYWDDFEIYEERSAPTYDARMGTSSAMFVPGFRVASTSGMAQEIVTGVKHGATVGSPDAVPVYDGNRVGAPAHAAQMSGSVIHDGGRYQMWFSGKQASSSWSTWYSESSDGVRWSTGRQVLTGVSPGGVVLNPDQSNPARRFLMLGVRGTMQMRLDKAVMPPFDVDYRTYASADGQHWTGLSAGPALPSRDVAVVSWDPLARQFVAMTKQPGGRVRQLFTSTSRDFLHWTTPHQSLRADTADPAKTDVYTAAVFRSGEELVALPSLYTAAAVRGVNGPVVPYYASSLDGVHFARPSVRQPSLPLGRLGSLDDGMILPANQPVTVDGKVRLYYGAWDGGHEASGRNPRIFYAEWEPERFASLRVTGANGSVTTRTLRPTGHDLTLNASVPAGGSLTVTVLDARTRAVIPGYEASSSTVVTGDDLASGVQWGTRTLRDLAERDIMLVLNATRGTKLYSFRIS